MLRKSLMSVLVPAALAAVVSPAVADGWRFAPLMTDPAFKLQPTVAVVAGSLDVKNGGSDTYAGVELNFNCGLVQSPGNRIRSHLQVGQYDKDGLELTTVELSPRYTVPLAGGWSVGVGPGIGYVRAETAGQKTSLAALQVVGGVNYRQGMYYAGVDARYQDARDKRVNGAELRVDNWLVAAKVGVNF